jgi:CubicO group peptidase (beta-lactamase class C family)
LKAYGNKQTYPDVQPMNVNTIFDLASCTKPLATATSVMILVEKGLIGLNDNVASYLPGFLNFGVSKDEKQIKIIHLLTHTSGLPAYAPVSALEKRSDLALPQVLSMYIDTCRRDFEPGSNMKYSCLNYITLQHVVEVVSGKSLRDFCKENIFDVLNMTHTDFNPGEEMKSDCAPTEKQKNGLVLKGVVHDPLARVMNGGISGNAGLFSNANDLGILMAALMNGGEINGKKILSPLTVELMTTLPESLKKFGRTPGWDMSSAYSGCKGDLFSSSTYCHTGYTGTSIVIDPENDVAVILLTNRVHPIDKGSVAKLRASVANAVAGSINKKTRSEK